MELGEAGASLTARCPALPEFQRPFQKGLCPVALSLPLCPMLVMSTPCPQLAPAPGGNGARRQGPDWGSEVCGLRSSPESGGVSGFSKPLPPSGSQSQKGPWFSLLKTGDVYPSPKCILCTSTVPVDVSRHYTQQFIIK